MPDFFCHNVIAEVVLERLPKAYREKIVDHTLYLLGAQGADVLFTYHATPTGNNLGREMHRRYAYPLMTALSQGNLSYAAGFVTHYCADSLLHPAVYRFDKGKPWKHNKFESDLGLYASRVYGVQRTILPRERVLARTFSLYDSLRRVAPHITVTGVERCLKRFYIVSRWTYARKRTKYVCDYPFENLKDDLEGVINKCVKIICDLIDGDLKKEDFTLPFLNKGE